MKEKLKIICGTSLYLIFNVFWAIAVPVFGWTAVFLFVNSYVQLLYLLFSFPFAKLPIPLLVYTMLSVALMIKTGMAQSKKQQNLYIYHRLIIGFAILNYVALYFYLPPHSWFGHLRDVGIGMSTAFW